MTSPSRDEAEAALYSPRLEERFQATVKAAPLRLGENWPAGCFGAANAFLALIGPSPGHYAEKQSAPAEGGPGRPSGSEMVIEREAVHFSEFHKRKTWIRLCAEVLGDEAEDKRYVHSLSAVLNLDWGNNPDAGNIPDAWLNTGLNKHVGPLLEKVRPRVVCAVTVDVWELLRSHIKPLEVEFPSCPLPYPKKSGKNSLSVFAISGCDFPTLLIWPGQHPSYLSNEGIEQTGEVCQWFLAES